MELQGTDGLLGIIIVVLSVALKYALKYLSAYLDAKIDLLKYQKKQAVITDVVEQAVNFVEEYARATEKFSDGKESLDSGQKKILASATIVENMKDQIDEDLSDKTAIQLLYAGLNKMRKK